METELKYVLAAGASWPVTEAALLALLARLGFSLDDRGARPQTDIYYDTPEGDLERTGCSLRIREVGEERLMTCKRPARNESGLFYREEAECPAAPGDFQTVENRAFAEAGFPGLVHRLAPVAVVENFRRTFDLTALSGARYELALDRVTYRDPAAGGTLEERQVELEEKSGGMSGLTAVREAVAREIPALFPAADSKYQRAKAFIRGGGPCIG